MIPVWLCVVIAAIMALSGIGLGMILGLLLAYGMGELYKRKGE